MEASAWPSKAVPRFEYTNSPRLVSVALRANASTPSRSCSNGFRCIRETHEDRDGLVELHALRRESSTMTGELRERDVGNGRASQRKQAVIEGTPPRPDGVA